MSFRIIDAPQRSPEWFAARAGRLTGSRATDLLATRQDGKPSASRKNLLADLVLERITGKPKAPGFVSQAMQDGIDREQAAFALYEAVTGSVLLRSGFLSHTEHMAGCSLDGHINGFEGIAEIKSPIDATHMEYLETGKVPLDYYRQALHNLWISGAQWCDWFSFHPDFPEPLQIKLVRIPRDEKAIAEYEKKALAFLGEVDAKVQAMQTALNLAATLSASSRPILKPCFDCGAESQTSVITEDGLTRIYCRPCVATRDREGYLFHSAPRAQQGAA